MLTSWFFMAEDLSLLTGDRNYFMMIYSETADLSIYYYLYYNYSNMIVYTAKYCHDIIGKQQ